jgi:hypothetical protein
MSELPTSRGGAPTVAPLTRREAATRLASAQKSNRGAAGYSRWINRPAGRQLAAIAYVLRLTPNQVSLISAGFTYAAIALIACLRPSWPVAVVIVLALLFGYALDSADGQLARLRGGGSPAGEWLDHVLDALKISTFHLAIAISWFRFEHLHRSAELLIPLAYSTTSAVFFFALILSDMLRRIDRVRAGGTSVTTSSVNPDEPAPILRSLAVLPNDYGVLCLCMLLLPAHRAFEIIYSALLAANFLLALAGGVRWFREMNGLAR